ncbi:Thioredoxin H2 [Vitis vinifera]|uniref:Thioredoxin H2 n=1 Tax=Vitis vinifera TaxID=29760 RepID=A0A438JID3_VITVI|nr:Thioredoxin H2 [Vitis vinifera]
MVIDFAATWCGPCKFMEPAVKSMASKYTDVDFVKIDVDELPDVAQEFTVQAMPTFVLLKKGKEFERVIGAKKDELEKKIQKHRAVSNP